jgi:hypothetical protein
MDWTRIVKQVALGVTVLASAARADTLYVDDDAPPGGDGQSWDTAYRFLQDALPDACSDPGISEVRVAQGTYTPDRGEANPEGSGDRGATFQLCDGVALMGGYAGLGAGDPDQRNIELYETILSGDLAGDDLDWPDADNCYHVVTGSGTNETAALDGVTVTAGAAYWSYQDPVHASRGAGMYNEAGNPTVTSCTFSGNALPYLGRGGGMANWQSNPTVIGCTFSGNGSGLGSSGGGMYNHNSHPTVANCTFIGNGLEGAGGGMMNSYSNPTVTDCTFSGNLAWDGGGGMYNSNSSPTVTDSTFCGNRPDHIHGQVVLDGQIDVSTFCPIAVCPSDTNGDGEVNVSDFLAMLANWGLCP